MYLYILLALFFISGLVVGSFLNVVIYRLENKKRKTLGGRSFCPKCEAKIAWYDNMPVISWVFLNGKCRSCDKKISIQYPLVELGTGLIFSAIGWFFLDSGQARMTEMGASMTHFLSVIPALNQSSAQASAGIQPFAGVLNLLFWLFFAACLIIIFVYDFKHQIIPDEVIYPALVGALLFAGIQALTGKDLNFLTDHLLAGLAAGSFFYFLAVVSKGKWMGGGDIKLVTFMGLALGLQGVLVALYISFVLGALVGVFALLSKQKKLGSKIAFGPFLVIGTFASLFFADTLVSFYVKMFM